MNNKKHSHLFVDHYEGLVGFGLDRETDEKSLMVYLQKFSDDAHLACLLPRLKDQEIREILDLLSRLLKTHLNEEEYHRLFLKDTESQPTVPEAPLQEIQPFPEKRLPPGEDQLRWLCSKRDLVWEQMSEEEREVFINDLTRA
jgi:hypothetical protein